MRGSNEQLRAGEFEPVAAMLRERRASPEPLELERLKQRVLARRPAGGDRLRARIATAFAILGLAAGAGGALAVAENSGSAARGQYCPPKSRVRHGKCYPMHHRKHHQREEHKDRRHDHGHDH